VPRGIAGGHAARTDRKRQPRRAAGRKARSTPHPADGDCNRLALRRKKFARGRLRRKRDQLESALEGSIGQHQRFILGHLLQHIEFVERQIEQLSAEIEARMRPYEAHMESLQRIPGIGRRGVEAILAEIGVEMSYWPTAEAIASWAKICPGNNESGGKRRSTSIGRGNQSLRGALVEATLAAIRVKDSYFSGL